MGQVMGLTTVKVKVKRSRESRKARMVECLVDSGASYSLVDARLLRAVGCKPYVSQDFFLADGTKITRKMGDAYFELGEIGGASRVIFGEPGDEALLGVTTLESLGLMLDPFKRQLRPMKLMLAGVAGTGRTGAGGSYQQS